MSVGSLTRLSMELRDWQEFPLDGFIARPIKNLDGTINLLSWECVIPGENDTPWQGGLFKLHLFFKNNYPLSPPECIFVPPLFHPNVDQSGLVGIPLLLDNWTLDSTIKEVLLVIQDTLNNPNLEYPANPEACKVYYENWVTYRKRITEQTISMSAPK